MKKPGIVVAAAVGAVALVAGGALLQSANATGSGDNGDAGTPQSQSQSQSDQGSVGPQSFPVTATVRGAEGADSKAKIPAVVCAVGYTWNATSPGTDPVSSVFAGTTVCGNGKKSLESQAVRADLRNAGTGKVEKSGAWNEAPGSSAYTAISTSTLNGMPAGQKHYVHVEAVFTLNSASGGWGKADGEKCKNVGKYELRCAYDGKQFAAPMER